MRTAAALRKTSQAYDMIRMAEKGKRVIQIC